MAHFRLNPSVITSAQRTGKLDLHGRALHDVPSDIFSREIAPSLHVLDLSENRLSTLPADIASLRNLRELYLDSNSLTSLPVELLLLPNLKAISLENNARLPSELRNIYDKANPIFKSRARDVVPVLAYLANQVEQSQAGGGGGGGADAGYERDSHQQGQLQQRPDSRGRDQDRPAAGGNPLDDEDYMYAQMRARAAARAAAEGTGPSSEAAAAPRGHFYDDDEPEERGGRGGGRDAEREYERERGGYERERESERAPVREQPRDYERERPQQQSQYDRDFDRDFSPAHESARRLTAGPQSGADSNVSTSNNAPAAGARISRPDSGAQQQRFATRPRQESPFYSDPGLKVGANQDITMSFKERQAAQARAAAQAFEANQAQRTLAAQRAGSNIFADGEFDRRSGRKTGASAGVIAPVPFGTEKDTSAPPASNPRTAGTAGAPQRRVAPFGTDLSSGSDYPAARRQPDPSLVSRSSIANGPFASIDGPGPRAGDQAARGVRITRPQGPSGIASAPFGVLPQGAAESHYQTSSASAANHVQAAARLRAQGGLDTSSATSPTYGSSQQRSPPFEDGSISGNGPRNSSVQRNAYGGSGRPNSDIFPRAEQGQREVGQFGREQRYGDPSSGGAQEQQSRGGRPSGAASGFSAPFARDSDVPASSSGNSRGNRSNQSSVFNSDAPPPQQQHGGRQASGRPAQSTSLW